jgi:hypothetical protein
VGKIVATGVQLSMERDDDAFVIIPSNDRNGRESKRKRCLECYFSEDWRL